MADRAVSGLSGPVGGTRAVCTTCIERSGLASRCIYTAEHGLHIVDVCLSALGFGATGRAG